MAINQLNKYTPFSAVAVTPHNTNMNQYAGLYVGVGGDVTVVTENGETTTFVGVPAGQYIWVRTRQVKATGTSASSIVGLN